ncbi:MAG: flagellar basal-body MS-ring/collar protein FliF [Spirochaetes bacterium]|nr:flagellar basal-body MS-ring/collar protein FliF [Spirochaetota bacterium]
MNEWFRKIGERLKAVWGKWTLVQKLILTGIVVAAIVAVFVFVRVSSAPSMVKLISTPIRNEDELRLITSRLDSEGIPFEVGENNVLYVKDEKTRARANAILIREDLIPKGTDPWAVFAIDRFTVTDFERDVNLRKSIIQEVTRHIESLGDVDKANVIIELPAKELFEADQKPVTASIIIYPKPGSDITTNRKKLEGIQKVIQFAVAGLKPESIVIADQNGVVLNDFAGLEDFDRLERTKREQQLIQRLETQYRAAVLKALQQIYTEDRVRDLNLKIAMDMSKKSIATREFFPFIEQPDDPNTPFYDAKVSPSVTRSSSQTNYEYQGTGFNPEGPAGVEGQTSPAYKDMQNMVGTAKQTQAITNNEINERNIQEDYSPGIDRLSVSVNIDGIWKWKYDDKGNPVVKPDGSIEREYLAIPAEELKSAEKLIQDAIGYQRARGDSVTVQNIRFDRTAQFKEEDGAFARQQQVNVIILSSLIGVAIIMIAFIIFRVIQRNLERRRRMSEEKRALEQQMLRENAIRQAEESTIEVSKSVEERKRLELQEHAINMAKDHPEDVAQLIRTWIREEG